MATAKKTTRKKTASVKRTRTPKTVQLQSFKVGPEPRPFLTFSITDQTVIWSILLILLLLLGLWVLNIQMDISNTLLG